MKTNCLNVLLLILLLVPFSLFAQNASHGADEYKLCASCHGFDGEGNHLVNAPSLSNQAAWYLERQIRNFRQGVRGHENDDFPAQTMAQMTRGLTSDEQILDILAYIDTLPPVQPKQTIEGSVEKGRAAYSACAACHGADAKGNENLNAPALFGLDDWYQLAQLQKFKSGARGGLAADTYGQQMAPMTMTLADEQAMKDVIAYILSLN